jgi:hypothetical protein
MTAHAPLHRTRHHLPHPRLDHLLFVALVAGLALFVLEQALHARRGAEAPPRAAAAATQPLHVG